jgi:hypothetical protein
MKMRGRWSLLISGIAAIPSASTTSTTRAKNPSGVLTNWITLLSEPSSFDFAGGRAIFDHPHDL